MTEAAKPAAKPAAKLPPDWQERTRALDPSQSFLVQAPAGSGKTYLLTQRFLRLLAQAERPDEIVAITFTIAAAAEMRNRVLEALESAESRPTASTPGPQTGEVESLEELAARALNHAKRMGWQILELPGQLRITTIDAFCRGLALQSPLSWGLLSGLGGTLNLSNSKEAHRRAARRTIELLEGEDSPARRSVEALLLWRDNNWQDIENLIVQMLQNRNRWFQDFVFERDADWSALRRRLEAPLLRAARRKLETICTMLDRLDGCRDYVLDLARFACANGGASVPAGLAERAELPSNFPAAGSEDEAPQLEDAVAACGDLAAFLLTNSGTWRKSGGLNKNHGFPPTPQGKAGKEKFGELVAGLAEEPGLEAALGAFQNATPLRYEEQEWELIRHCFAVLRTAAAHLQLVFAETGSVDFTEVAQIAQRVLAPEGGYASDFAQRQADSIRHLLVDEFQDTSRQQHELLARIVAAWPEREGRSCFCVGDPMQSIYGFRDAEVELFERLKTNGLETVSDQDFEPFPFEFVRLEANFRTVPTLVNDLNGRFALVFGENSGAKSDPGSVQFASAIAAREAESAAQTKLHLAFTHSGGKDAGGPASSAPETTRETQLQELVTLIRDKLEAARQRGTTKYRIAVLARARKSLIPIAAALSDAGIGFRALDLVKLNERPEVQDALTLARALMNPADRTAWLGVLRAPWCGMSLAELHLLTSADEANISAAAVPVLLEKRLLEIRGQIGERAFHAAVRVAKVLRIAQAERAAVNGTLGTWLESIWKALGGADTVNRAQAENLSVLWTALDKLPEGELDLLGAGLDAALDELYALPDPASSSEFGVQLMTIHKSKGLEFEVVLVPDLEARSKGSDHGLMSWLERGLAEAGPDGEISEFLIAPIKTKGGEASEAKRWVDGVKKERESLELRRLFYVAATRAREELHLFARPRFGLGKTPGEAVLAKPTGLLQTAWPAFEEEVTQRFDDWWNGISAEIAAEELTNLAAEAASPAANLLQMPASVSSPARATRMRRLPENYAAPEFKPAGMEGGGSAAAEPVYARTEGGIESRLLGSAIHALLERYGHLRATLEPDEALRELDSPPPSIVAMLRSGGLARAAAERLATEALTVVRHAAADRDGAWILAPHIEAENEARWTGFARPGARRPSNLRPDRVFFAARPGEAEPSWWIVDYKSADLVAAAGEAEMLAFRQEHRARYAPQLEAYAQVLRDLHPGQTPRLQVGIFYPRLPLLDHWIVDGANSQETSSTNSRSNK